MIRLAPEGWPFVAVGLVLTSLLVGGALLLLPPGSGAARTMTLGLAGVMGALTVFTLYFFRDPVRIPPPGEELVLAPGDGRVIQIVQVPEPTFLGGTATRISIFLSVFNVHVQRAPVSGTVGHRDYFPGSYLAAWNPKASEENERASVGIQAGPHRVLVRQIAGLVARRVVTDHREGDAVTRGDRIGLIRFGSRVDLFVPPEWELLCSEGDRVKAGLSVMARMPGEVRND